MNIISFSFLMNTICLKGNVKFLFLLLIMPEIIMSGASVCQVGLMKNHPQAKLVSLTSVLVIITSWDFET